MQIRTSLQGLRSATVVVSVAIAAACGCTHSDPPSQRTMTVRCDLPVITPQTETSAPQSKGGLSLSVMPVLYTAQRHDKVKMRQVAEPIGDQLVGGNPGYIYVEREITPALAPQPEQLRFQVNINNKMARVFHGAGTVVQFNLDGQVLAVDQRGYSTFQGAIVPPRQEQQIEIIGPPLSVLKKDKGILGIFLYDVVTKESDAGVVTEKQNFEWYFNYVIQHNEEQLPAPQRMVVRMTPMDFNQQMMRQAMEARRQPADGAANTAYAPGYPSSSSPTPSP